MVDDEEEPQMMPGRSPLQNRSSTTSRIGGQGIVKHDDGPEEPVQAIPVPIPVHSPLQRTGSSTSISGGRGVVMVEEEEDIQTMPAEVMQQRSGFVRQ